MDDSYTRAIGTAVANVAKPEADLVRHLIETSMWNWRSRSDYTSARDLVRSIGEAPRSMVRLEIGNANQTSYEVLWLVETGEAVWLITNMQRSIERVAVQPAAWRRLSAKLQALNLESLGSAADTGVDDGSTHFFSFCDPSKVVEFAVYGLPLGEEVAPGQRDFAPKVRRQSEAVRSLLDFVREQRDAGEAPDRS
jgi:hypothetical protein